MIQIFTPKEVRKTIRSALIAFSGAIGVFIVNLYMGMSLKIAVLSALVAEIVPLLVNTSKIKIQTARELKPGGKEDTP